MRIWQAVLISLGVHAGFGGVTIASRVPETPRLDVSDPEAVPSEIDQIAVIRLGIESRRQLAEPEPDIPLPKPVVKQAEAELPSDLPETDAVEKIANKPEPLSVPREVTRVASQSAPDEASVQDRVEAPVSPQPSVAQSPPTSSQVFPRVQEDAGHPDGDAMPRAESQPALTSSQKRAQQNYLTELMKWLAKHRTYPPKLKKAGVDGTTKVRFTIHRDGRISDAVVAKSSGNAELDAAALDVLQQANPGPKFPRKLPRDAFTLTLPIEFSLITE